MNLNRTYMILFLSTVLLSSNIYGAAQNTIPVTFALEQNSPNPFHPMTVISYQLPENCNVNLRIYTLRGDVVRTLVNQPREKGIYEIVWNGLDDHARYVESGVYVYRLQAGTNAATRKLTLLK
ncbi:T9SS type A sorting domain-containing protein [candidate division KSB1 bacterium]|nr:T9SS type A sorting domain-containing protein [candidate division KSB1 bacterium]